MFSYPLKAAAGKGVLSGIHKCDLPGLCLMIVDMHFIAAHIEGHIGHVKEVVRKELLDHIAFVAAANHKLVDPMGRVYLHDMPEDRHASYFDHRLRLFICFLGNPGAESPC